jgi:hypothetical protein
MVSSREALEIRRCSLKRMIMNYEKGWYDEKTITKEEAKAKLQTFRVQLDLVIRTLK